MARQCRDVCRSERLYLQLDSDQFMKSYELRTGKELVTFDQAFPSANTNRLPGSAKANRRVVCCAVNQVAPLPMEAGSGLHAPHLRFGRRDWRPHLMHEDQQATFNRPLVQNGKLVVLSGPAEERFRTTGNYKSDLEAFYTNEVVAFDLASGSKAWSYTNPHPDIYPAVRNLASKDGCWGDV